MAILIVCNHDDADQVDPFVGVSHPRRGDVADIVSDDHVFGGLEINSNRLMLVRCAADRAQLEHLLESEVGWNSDVSRSPWRRRRLDLRKVFAIAGVRALNDERIGMVIDVPAQCVDALLATAFEPPRATNEQVIL